MNERKLIVLAVFLILGLFLIGKFTSYSGNVPKGDPVCTQLNGFGNMFEKQCVRYGFRDSEIPFKTMCDTCATQASVMEVSCPLGRYPERAVIQCPMDYYCNNGVCIKGNIEEEKTGCEDITENDKEGNIWVKGITISYNEKGEERKSIFTDTCATDGTVIEFSCRDSGVVNKKILQCPTNKCFDGACIQAN